jgi:hypothetical protein
MVIINNTFVIYFSYNKKISKRNDVFWDFSVIKMITICSNLIFQRNNHRNLSWYPTFFRRQ